MGRAGDALINTRQREIVMVQRIAVVTGAGAGAGRAIALRFGASGWRVGLIARDAQRLEDAKRQIESAGGEALVLPADVADASAVDRAVTASWRSGIASTRGSTLRW